MKWFISRVGFLCINRNLKFYFWGLFFIDGFILSVCKKRFYEIVGFLCLIIMSIFLKYVY